MTEQQQSNCQTEKKIQHIPKNNIPVFGPDEKGNIVRLKNTSESRAKKWLKQKKATPIKLLNGRYGIELKDKPLGNIRVAVLNPDGTPAMPTKSSRARKWIKDGKAIGKRTKSGKFYVQLIEEPSGRKKQDPEMSRYFSGIPQLYREFPVLFSRNESFILTFHHISLHILQHNTSYSRTNPHITSPDT